MRKEHQKQKDSTKLYLLIVVVVALLGTNVYLYFKNKKVHEQVSVVNDQKTKMQTDIDRIELALDSANQENVQLSSQMKEEQQQARKKIGELRIALKRGELTQSQLAKAQEEIKLLRSFVAQYTTEIEDLKKQNENLTTERDVLKTQVDSAVEKVGTLEKQNQDLVTAAAALKTSSIQILPLKIRRNGKEVSAPKAKQVTKLQINFTLVNNSLAKKGMHDVFIRITDPSENFLSTEEGGGQFMVYGSPLSYTYRTTIEFANDDKMYSIDWLNHVPFVKGAYSIVLYADGAIMGKGSVSLR